MAAIAEFHDRFGGQPVSDARMVGGKPPLWWVTWAFVTVMITAVIMLGWNGLRESWIEQGVAQGKQSAQAELQQLKTEVAKLRAEVTRLERGLAAEIARKQELAVENTQLKAAKKQLGADHKVLAVTLKEGKKPTPRRRP